MHFAPCAAPGWVYILTNPGLPGVVKIGLTTRTTTRRAAELLREYGTVYPFVVASRHAVADSAAVEAAAHRLLNPYRLPASELFRCDVETAQKAVLSAAAGVLAAPWWVRAWDRLRRPRRASHSYWRGRHDPIDGVVLLLAVAVVFALVLLKPSLPSWLPSPLVHTLATVERLRR